MKKRMIMGLLVCTIFVTGCGNNASEQRVGEIVNSTELIEITEEQDLKEQNPEEIDEVEILDQLAGTSILGRITYAGSSYAWEEISVTIPKAWEEKYVVKEDANGISFYQKASNEKEKTLGFLCGIYRSEQYSNGGAGEQLVAYTDNGILYYMMKPTDVACYTEDEAIVAEYGEMMQYVDWIAGSMEVRAEAVHYDVSQHEIPVSSIMPLEEHHVVNLTNNQLWIARNEIYARHGKVFQNEYLASYFGTCSWYEPKEGKAEVSERELNEVEVANLKLIVAAEEAYAKEHPYPKQYLLGEAIEVGLYASQEKQIVSYEVLEGTESEYKCVLTIDDEIYELDDYVTMVTPVEDVFYVTDIAYYDNKLEIAVLDYGPSADMATHFFQYDGQLHYVGAVSGFPFEDYGNNFFDGFTGQNSVIGTTQVDLIESAFVYTYYWYNTNERTLQQMESISSKYTWYDAHELYEDIPIYFKPNEKSPMLTLKAGEEVYFIETDCKEWILVRGANGVEGYIHVKDGQVLNIGLPAEEVFSELYFFS